MSFQKDNTYGPRFQKGNTYGFKKGHKRTGGIKKGSGHEAWNKKEITWKVNENGCWMCTSHKTDKDGYPICKRNGKVTKIHRLFYEKYNSEISKGLEVCHKCDNPTCINPEHLFLGTHLENMHDKDAKGRNTKGQNNRSSKLTEEDVMQIKYNLLDLSRKEIAEKYNISIGYVSVIRKNKKWKHVKEAI